MDELAKKIISVTRNMRETAYKIGKSTNHYDEVPFGGSIRESIGPFPEFILKGRFCARSQCGMCSPCFYSRLPLHNLTSDEFNIGYIEQVKHISEHFFDKVQANQKGAVAHDFKTTKPIYGMVCTPTGSYFDGNEYPPEVRIKNLKKLVEMKNLHGCEIVLHIESHAEDVIQYFEDPICEELALLSVLHARILLGFESSNDFSRNVIYSKQLPLPTFEKAVCILKKAGFPVGAFVFSGLFAMTENELVQDAESSFEYLKRLNVSPVLMFANTQDYTIPDVLLRFGEYKLQDPRTVCRIVKKMIAVFGNDMSGNIDPWFIADPIGGPPEPSSHLFNAKTSTTCRACSQKIYAAIENLRITKDFSTFYNLIEEVEKCSCGNRYANLLEKQRSIELEDIFLRVERAVNYAEEKFDFYVLQRNPWIIKAELLCYGLRLTEDQVREITNINPFINEKGFINATHIKYQNTIINVCVAEEFCKNSPYTLVFEEKKWILQKDGCSLGEIRFIDYPDWVFKQIDGVMIGTIVRPHSDKCLSLWPSTDCIYVNNNKACKFCGLSAPYAVKRIVPPTTVVKMIGEALRYDPEYEINISGGACKSRDYCIEYLCAICDKIKEEFGAVPISVECAPPENLDLLIKLKKSGATAIVMNLEVYNDDLRKKICPGKGEIPKSKYYEALEKSVSLFGRGSVSSVLIVGIQPSDDIKDACKQFIEMGVIPTLLPLKPLDGTDMENHSIVNPREYIEISKWSSDIMMKNNLKIGMKSGCASCGACSLEIDI